jgi:hypothetical protein
LSDPEIIIEEIDAVIEVVDPALGEEVQATIEVVYQDILIEDSRSGPQGPQGVAGPSGPGATTYTHQQTSPSAIWVITHNLGRHPAVDIVDSSGNVVIGEIRYNSDNQITVTFIAAFSGKAYLN